MTTVNQRGSLIFTREVIKAMLLQDPLSTISTSPKRPAQRGSIVNVSSFYAATGTMAMSGSYVPTKYAVSGISKAAGMLYLSARDNSSADTHLALDHAQDSIRVNTVLPGYVNTEGLQTHQDATPELVSHITSQIAMKRLGAAEEIADVIVFLSSPMASYVTGASWVVDGGISLA